MRIGDFEIGKGKTFIIAELSANHNGSLEIAKETVRAAKRAGADCIKLQTYKADTITLDVKNDQFKIKHGTAWDGRYLFDLYEEAHLPWDWHKPLFETAKEEGLICFSSPFDFTAIDLLETFDVPAYKIASYEITDIPLIEYAASKGKPIIISTGIAEVEDIELALDACRRQNNNDIILLKCTSAYPTDPNEANLSAIATIADKFNVTPGFSDHTLGIVAPVMSIAYGATVIEKHFILDKSEGGVDSHFSLDEKEFKEMVDAVRLAEKMVGVNKFVTNDKMKGQRDFSRSLYISADVKSGDVVTKENIKSVRPGFGLHPKYYKEALGKTFVVDAAKGTPLSLDMFK
ncbi:pseudaminic acid synthase [Paracrocinitomix mangrovi]|uniref:pseudaminic acid synthase n=1 Tax=Paracrocinitomix mangrovi TaxID=2862509 RepID=UPI001C8D04D9|nr:pseudaminic acid synthase [Paracrocinitomix mangrovi]UKN02776.1 pseudaminic acid synthase [Paracrocinitomix mangrovi]